MVKVGVRVGALCRGAGLWFALFLGLTLLVQARLLAPLDEVGMRLVAAYRPPAMAEVMNWAFRLGFVQVDVALALLLSVWLVARRRPQPVALAPLLIVAAIGVQAGLRLVVEQPPPRGSFELQRVTPAQPVGYILDRADAAARESFAAAAPSGAPAEERGSYPSGHACRILFLALAVDWLMLRDRRRAKGGDRREPAAGGRLHALAARRLALAGIAILVGYSTLYFGYHWPSDVLGGYLLAMGVYRAVRGLIQPEAA